MIVKEHIAIEELNNNLSLLINKTIPSSKQKVVCRVILNADFVLQRSLQLPHIELMPYEIDTYVKNSLAKIFHTNDRLAYDYIIDSEPLLSKQDQQLTIYACQNDFIKEYQIKVSQWNIDFFGIPDILFQQLDSQITESEIDRIAYSRYLQGINFLPWRELSQRRRRKYFLSVITGYLLITVVIAALLIHFATQKREQQIIANEILHNQYLQKVSQLSSLIDLEQQNRQLQLIVSDYERLKQQHITLLDYFALLPESIPEDVWLESLEYQDSIMVLKGQSFLYADILLFSELLNRHHLVQNSNITVIKKHSFRLLFNMQIRFIQNAM